MSKNNKKIKKKKAHEREAKKRVIKRRLALREDRKIERLRNEAFEREFALKQNLGFTEDEIKEKLKQNMKILEALEAEYEKEEAARSNHSKETMESIKKSMEEVNAKLQENNDAEKKPENTEENTNVSS